MLKHNDTSESQQNTVPWWREAEQEQQASAVAKTTTAPEEILFPEARDIGEELEEEAQQRALYVPNEVVISWSTAGYYRKIRRWFGIVGITFTTVMTALIAAIAIWFRQMPPLSVLLPIAYLWAEIVGINLLFQHLEKKARTSSITLSPEGIRTAFPFQTTESTIPWQEIAEIRPYRHLFNRYIGIVPKDTKALSKQLGGPTGRLLSLNDSICRFYSSFGIFIAPINIFATALSPSAEELMAQIRAYQLSQAAHAVMIEE